MIFFSLSSKKECKFSFPISQKILSFTTIDRASEQPDAPLWHSYSQSVSPFGPFLPHSLFSAFCVALPFHRLFSSPLLRPSPEQRHRAHTCELAARPPSRAPSLPRSLALPWPPCTPLSLRLSSSTSSGDEDDGGGSDEVGRRGIWI
jgi:hypothetical protein